MEDGRTHLAFKAKHIVDVDNEFLLHDEVYSAAAGDAETLVDSMMRKLFGVGKPRSLWAILTLTDLLRFALNLVERTLFTAEHFKQQKSMKLKLNQQFMWVG